MDREYRALVDDVDLVLVSGRETMELAARIDLLEAELMREPFLGISEATRATSQTIHDLKITVGAVRGAVQLYRDAIARGRTDAELVGGARSIVAPYECWVLAWRRGGHDEWKRVRRLQHERRPGAL